MSENKDYFKTAKPYYEEKKVKDSPLSAGFEQKDFKLDEDNAEKIKEYNPIKIMTGIILSSITLLIFIAMTLDTY